MERLWHRQCPDLNTASWLKVLPLHLYFIKTTCFPPTAQLYATPGTSTPHSSGSGGGEKRREDVSVCLPPGKKCLYSHSVIPRDPAVANHVRLNSCSCLKLLGQMLRGLLCACVHRSACVRACVCVCFGVSLISLNAALHYCRLTLLSHRAHLLTFPYTHALGDRLAERRKAGGGSVSIKTH